MNFRGLFNANAIPVGEQLLCYLAQRLGNKGIRTFDKISCPKWTQ